MTRRSPRLVAPAQGTEKKNQEEISHEKITARLMNPIFETSMNSMIQEEVEEKEEVQVALSVDVVTLEVSTKVDSLQKALCL